MMDIQNSQLKPTMTLFGRCATSVIRKDGTSYPYPRSIRANIVNCSVLSCLSIRASASTKLT